ncbi:hypothetical protein QR297_21180 [Pseudomonas shirazica]|uniref:Uncharacterized protein n=3 Tax=Pseudomonas TaxID=286 RepID=A0ABY9SPI0_9PSED|nr:hypothetical protein [Pseudomonas shirazica]WMY84440.1 hypothetical protein QR297_21180 [Pseudomonas shirazica]
MSFLAPVRSSAARAALRSTRLLLHLFRANYSCAIGARTLGAWQEIDEEQQAQPSMLNGTDKAVARARHRRDWPETDVGAALCCEAPRGRRSISQAQKVLWRAPGSLDKVFAWNISNK